VDTQVLPANAIHSREDAPVLKTNASLCRSDLDLAKRKDQALKLPV
jgi:hypothetical protein